MMKVLVNKKKYTISINEKNDKNSIYYNANYYGGLRKVNNEEILRNSVKNDKL